MPLPEVDALFPDYAANRARGLCACCGKPIGPFRDALSEKEYGISGLRQECQDAVFGEPATYPEDIEA